MINNIFLAIDWGSVGLKVAQFLLSLSLLIVLHEFGHYITAKWFKVKVEKFFLFFDAGFALVKKKIGETVYGIGWLPLGGYVKLAGMIDESLDGEQLKQPPQPWEFRSKPAWQRLIIMLGGIIMNVLVAFIIYAGILMYWGDEKISNNSLKYGISVQDSLMFRLGFQNGDRFVSIDNKPVDNFYQVVNKLLVAKQAVVNRNGEDVTVQLPIDLLGQLAEKKRSNAPLIGIRSPMWVGGFDPKSPLTAANTGLQRWDSVVAINGMAMPFMDDAEQIFLKNKNNKVAVTLSRNGKQFAQQWKLDENGYPKGILFIGLPQSLDSAGVIDYEVKKYGFFAALPAGVSKTFSSLSSYVQQFKAILNPKTGGYKAVGGFKSMASVFDGYQWNWESFWKITAFLSIVLAFMNLLPIPALDGGHVLFTIIEMITGKKPSEKFLEYAQIIGMILLFGLMLYANGNDWFGWGKNR